MIIHVFNSNVCALPSETYDPPAVAFIKYFQEIYEENIINMIDSKHTARSPKIVMPISAFCYKGVYRVSIVKRSLLSTLPYISAFYDFIKKNV